MPRVSPEQLIRQFHENGLKLLLYDAANVRDLVTLRDPARAARIDFARLTVDPTSYVAADYRHLCSDLVLKVPYRTRLAGRPRTLTLYLLLEHLCGSPHKCSYVVEAVMWRTTEPPPVLSVRIQVGRHITDQATRTSGTPSSPYPPSTAWRSARH